jgi:hypothetical protein
MLFYKYSSYTNSAICHITKIMLYYLFVCQVLPDSVATNYNKTIGTIQAMIAHCRLRNNSQGMGLLVTQRPRHRQSGSWHIRQPNTLWPYTQPFIVTVGLDLSTSIQNSLTFNWVIWPMVLRQNNYGDVFRYYFHYYIIIITSLVFILVTHQNCSAIPNRP